MAWCYILIGLIILSVVLAALVANGEENWCSKCYYRNNDVSGYACKTCKDYNHYMRK